MENENEMKTINDKIVVANTLKAIIKDAMERFNYASWPIHPVYFDYFVKHHVHNLSVDVGILNEMFVQLCINPFHGTWEISSTLWDIIGEAESSIDMDFQRVSKIAHLGEQLDNQGTSIGTFIDDDNNINYLTTLYYDFNIDMDASDCENLSDIPDSIEPVTFHDAYFLVENYIIKLQNQLAKLSQD